MNKTEDRIPLAATGGYGAAARRFVVILALGFWLGGFTFYSGVVIHTGHRVFGSARETGFLTRQVTGWLNWIGVVALVVLFWNALASRRSPGRRERIALWTTWGFMAAVQVALFILHPVLDRMLVVETHHILDRARFYGVHRHYMNLSTAQWAAGLLHLWLVLWVWRAEDRSVAVPPPQRSAEAL